MPTYRVKELSYINNSLRKAGDEVEYDGVPGPNLEPLDIKAEVAVKKGSALPKATSDLIAQVRQHAATRGVSPDKANVNDFDEVLAVLPNKPQRRSRTDRKAIHVRKTL